jgi:LacI family transcriptional regulator
LQSIAGCLEGDHFPAVAVFGRRLFPQPFVALLQNLSEAGGTMRDVTINDIANELGISDSTVSRALHNNPHISNRVIQEVTRTAARLGYVPNIAARGLRTGKSNLIGLLVRDIRDGWAVEMIPSIENACAEHGYGLFLCNSYDDLKTERFYLQMLQQRRVDGILMLTPMSASADPYSSFRRSLPIVLIDIESEEPPSMCALTVDHVQGGYLSTKHLLELGHRQIACLSGPMTLSPCIRFVKGYKLAMAEAGVPTKDHFVIVAETDIPGGNEGMIEILRIAPQPTGLVSVSDMMAAGALDVARKSGISVPGDFSIIGYDDIPLGALLSPPLTTIVQDRELLGKAAVETLLEEINDKEHVHRQIKVQPKLVIRGSTAQPPAK